MKVIAISDIHGYLPQLEPCDMVVMSGDFSPLALQCDNLSMMVWCEKQFIPWMMGLRCKHFVFCAGNHDFVCEWRQWQTNFSSLMRKSNGVGKIHYLENTSVNIEGKTVFGCPYSDIARWAFSTITKNAKAYQDIPYHLDLLLVHQAPDIEDMGTSHIGTPQEHNWGSKGLLDVIRDRKPRNVVCGHIHSGNHDKVTYGGTNFYNASLKDEAYMVAYPPVVFDL